MRNHSKQTTPSASGRTTAIAHTSAQAGLTLGAIGVVFGDIGTSPLYALHAIFGSLGLGLAVTTTNVYGIISLIIWSIILVVCLKYVTFVMRADNRGEGGIMALVALLKRTSEQRPNQRTPKAAARTWPFILLGLVGVALFFGNSTITPAISILSAVEGLEVVAPSLAAIVIPATLVLLAFLFWIQRYGTSFIGRIFAPVMVLWFLTIGIAGAARIMQHPEALWALSPTSALAFIGAQPLLAFLAMGAVILAVTGVEGLYADMGHFGRSPIVRAWFALVFPALLLCYVGQGAILATTPTATDSPLMALFPSVIQPAIVILATAAALIASQSVISGTFSLARQAIQLGFLPKMHIIHTSDHESGQIYIPFINSILFGLVILSVVIFGSSALLANAYGIAVAGTLITTTLLFLAVTRKVWNRPHWQTGLLAALFLTIDIIFIIANLPKIVTGGWFPLILSAVVLIMLLTWCKGQQIITTERKELEGSLQSFITRIHRLKRPPARIPGCAVYIGHHASYTPLALRAAVEKLHELHERVIIVIVRTSSSAHVPENERVEYSPLAYDDGISQLKITYGYHDSPNIPHTLRALVGTRPELDFNPDKVSYFISLSRIVPSRRRNMAGWRKHLYAIMSRNALSTSDYYKLPIDRTMEMRALIEL